MARCGAFKNVASQVATRRASTENGVHPCTPPYGSFGLPLIKPCHQQRQKAVP
jgi:hypothetical protein